MEELINIMGVNVNIWKGGEGKPLFLLLGWKGEFSEYRDLLDALASKQFKVFAVELPGVGKSDAAPRDWTFDDFLSLIREVLDYYSLPRVVVMAHSLGCVWAIKFTACFPHRVSKLIIVNSPVFSPKARILKKVFDTGFFVFTALLKVGEWALKALGWTFGLTKWKFSIISARNAFSGHYRFLARSKGVMRKILRILMEGDTRKDARNVKIPTLIVWGEKGGITPLSNSKVLRENIPNNDFVLVPSAPHRFNGEWAEDLACVASKWLKQNYRE